MKTTECEYQHHNNNIPHGFNLAKHPTCDSIRRERRMRQVQVQQQQQQELNYDITTSASTSQLGGLLHQQHDTRYYMSCYVAGGLSSSIRWVLSPLELIKTRLQTTTATATAIPSMMVMSPMATATSSLSTTSSSTMMSTFRHIYVNEGGISGLFRGITPTAVAYWFQTSTKYTLYEYLKDRLSSSSSDAHHNDTTTMSNWHRNLIYVTAAASAEAIADILMCPFEMIKVKMQTSIQQQSSIQQHQSMSTSSGIYRSNLFHNSQYRPLSTLPLQQQTSFPKEFIPALREMIYHRKQYNFPFGSLGPVWGRQIPGTIVNFFTFEMAVSTIYNTLERYSDTTNNPKRRSDYTPVQQLGVTVMAGYIAGVCCAIVSHPMDSIISLKSVPQHSHQSISQIIRTVGWYRLMTKGLGPRIVMTGQIIAFQWLLYDSIKSMCFGYTTSGG